MNDIDTVVQQADKDIIELMCLMWMQKQTNQEKYKIIKPYFERLNLYCDEYSLRFDKDTDLFSIHLTAIDGVEYEKDNDVLFMLFNKNKTLHAFNLPEKRHIIYIYIYKKKHYCMIEFFLNVYKKVRIKIICYKLKQNLIKYIRKQIFSKKTNTI